MSSALVPPELRELGDRAQALTKLTAHPSWDVLRLELDRVRSLYMSRLVRRMTSGGIKGPAIDQRELDYQRGFFSGAEWILQNPEKAEASLEEALQRGSE